MLIHNVAIVVAASADIFVVLVLVLLKLAVNRWPM